MNPVQYFVWRIQLELIGFKNLSYEDAVCQHSPEVKRAFHVQGRKHHPYKQAFATEADRLVATTNMQRILAAKSIIMVNKIDRNTGLPTPGADEQQRRIRYVRRFYLDEDGYALENAMRLQTNRRIFPGNISRN